MHPIKKIIIEETVNALREVKLRKKTSGLRKDLHEAVKTSSVLKNSKKKTVANKLVRIAEARLFNHRNKLKESHEFSDETEMAKAQLLAIVEKANELYKMMNKEMQLEDWVQYKLSIAENYIDAVHGYMKYFIGEKDMENDMDDQMDNQDWDDVEEEDYDEESDYYDGDEDESYEDFEDIDDFDFEEDYEDFDEDDEDSDEEFEVI